MTLARFKQYHRRDIEALLQRVQAMSAHFFGEWTAQEIEIVQSELSQNGAQHTPLAAFALA